MFGEYQQLDQRIEYDLRAKNAAELYQIVLERLEKDYDTDVSDSALLPLLVRFVYADYPAGQGGGERGDVPALGLPQGIVPRHGTLRPPSAARHRVPPLGSALRRYGRF